MPKVIGEVQKNTITIVLACAGVFASVKYVDFPLFLNL